MMNKKILTTIGILIIAGILIGGHHFCLNGERYRFVGANIASLPFLTHDEINKTLAVCSVVAMPDVVDQKKGGQKQLKQKLRQLKQRTKELRAKGYDISELKPILAKIKESYRSGEWEKVEQLLKEADAILEKIEKEKIPRKKVGKEKQEPSGKEKPDIIPEKYERPEQGWKEPAVLYKHIDLKPYKNVDSRGMVGYLYVGDLNGDGKVDFLYNVGLEYVRAFDHDGNLMWEIKSPLAGKVRGLGIRDVYHPKLAAIFDFDGDSENEVAILTLINERVKRGTLSIVNGSDGKIEKSVALPFKGFRGLLAVGYMRGGRTPEIAVTGSANCSWVAVYDSNLDMLWKKIFPNEKLGHYLWFCDIDDDGKQELFVGKRLFDENGNEVWNLRDFVETGDHIDSLSCADIIPENPGKEVVACGAIGVFCYNNKGKLLWKHESRKKADVIIRNPQTVLVGEFDKQRPGLEIRVQMKPPGYGRGVYPLSTQEWLLDCHGKVLFNAELPDWQGRWQIDWDGDRSQDEILLACGAVAKWENGNFKIVSYGPFGLKETKLQDSRYTPRPTSYAYEFDAIPMDITGDAREEIILWDDDEIIIVQNGAFFSRKLPSFRNDIAYILRYANRDYHTNAPIFFDYQTTPTKKGSKKGFITVCGHHFCLNGERYRFVGANVHWRFLSFPHDEIDGTFEEASKLGIKVIRVWLWDPQSYPEVRFEDIDYMLDSARRHDIKLIIALASHGGIVRYRIRAHPELKGEDPKKVRKGFFEDKEANELYRNFVYNLITRTNSINGIQYKEDPTIFSWELMNEPAYAAPSIDILINWIEKTSSYIRSIDQNHMISIGGEGNIKYYLTNQGENYFVKVHQIATNISFCTFHIYGHAEFSRNDYTKIIEGIIQDAHETLNKPIVMEEYGISKRKCNHTWTKEGFYQFMLDEFYSKDGDGTAFWIFTARSDLTEEELERENGISLHPDDAGLREIIKEKAKENEN